MNTRVAPWVPQISCCSVVPRSGIDNHVLARLLHRLGDGGRHFARLAVAEADAAGAVADHGQRGEGELFAALDRLGDAVDRDQLLLEVAAGLDVVEP